MGAHARKTVSKAGCFQLSHVERRRTEKIIKRSRHLVQTFLVQTFPAPDPGESKQRDGLCFSLVAFAERDLFCFSVERERRHLCLDLRLQRLSVPAFASTKHWRVFRTRGARGRVAFRRG